MYIKPFKTYDEQIVLLKDKNLIIEDEDSAKNILETENYYRLSGFTLTLRNKNDKFNGTTTFNDAMQIYYFDKELRSLLITYLEDIELSLRSHLAYELGKIDHETNPKIASYLNPEYYITEEHFKQVSSDLKEAHKNSGNEAFIKHYDTKYNGIMPPWVMVETLSFGKLTTMFEGLNVDIKKRIGELYYHGLNGKVLDNLFSGLVVLRNLCAHHARIINRGIIMVPQFSEEDKSYFLSQGYKDNQIGKRLFFRLIVIALLSDDQLGMVHKIETDIDNLCNKYPFVDLKGYDFKKNWKEILEHVIEKRDTIH